MSSYSSQCLEPPEMRVGSLWDGSNEIVKKALKWVHFSCLSFVLKVGLF